ncbi:hypothetical protein [Shewanella surugensis]|uniref:Core-binding (CB) domain-containing protein n=1 Tax=Shewanella surugensis TaxID=212020 RepID=A0ABT0LIV4_9GAMM|nr:hypothetical protein [Shewanella surugensis]MCL1127616.1 hypothetical protein [Shewanella surugensis]
MSNVIYISGWNASLCLQTDTDNNLLCDFNRLLYLDIPSTKYLKQGKHVISAKRDEFILKLKDRFVEKMKEGTSHITLYNYFGEILQYLRWSEKEYVEYFSQHSLQEYFDYLVKKVYLKKIKRTTYSKKLSDLTVVFRNFLDFPNKCFATIPLMGNSDQESFEAYSRSDLNQLLPLFRQIFNQTSKQFIENPKKHITAHKMTRTMIFKWQGKEYQLCGSITKMMCAATYLLSYYTYSNTGVIFGLIRPNNTSTSLGEEWYTMPAFKRRAFKSINVEMGEHNLEVPKYCMGFFDKLLEVSKELDSSNSGLLLQTVASKKPQPMKGITLQGFCKNWLDNKFALKDQTGRRLRPVISRFRETGAQLTAYYQGEIASNILMDNTLNVRKKHYSSGNKHTNNAMMQDTIAIRQEQAESKLSIKKAQISLGIEVLTIDEEYKVHIPKLSRTPNGSSCSNPFGEKSETYNRRARKHNLLKEGEKLACADLLACFGCPEQVIVQSVSDIWCLLSFRSCIEDSLYVHLDAHHYQQNFEDIVTYIDNNILPKIKRNILKKAEAKVNDEGNHPLWDDTESIISMIPKPSTKESNK